MDNRELSKIISHALRHAPEKYNIQLSNDGWVVISALVRGIRNNTSVFFNLTEIEVIDLVKKSVKKRHEIYNGKIRALYGHSLEFEDKLNNIEPPFFLYHATSFNKFLKIKTYGIKPMKRQYVHLAMTKAIANEAAQRKYQKTVLFKINAIKAFKNGISFYRPINNETIWLCKEVPPQYLSVSEGKIPN